MPKRNEEKRGRRKTTITDEMDVHIQNSNRTRDRASCECGGQKVAS